MKKISPALTIAIAFTILLGLAGCGNGPATRLGGYLNAVRSAERAKAASYCYDKNSYKDLDESLQSQIFGASVKVISVQENGDRPVREKGYEAKAVVGVEARMAGPMAEIEGRFKPLIDQANAVLSNAQAEYNNAVEMKKYAALTYGTNMPQYYEEQVRINNALPRLRNAQARVDELNAAKAAEVSALKAGAEAGYKKDKADSDKALAANSIDLPTCDVRVELKQGGSAQQLTFVLVEDEVWKVYSVSSAK